MKIKYVLSLLRRVKEHKKFSLYYTTYDPLLWFLWRRIQDEERKKHGSKKVSYMIIKRGLVNGAKKYYPELYEDFKRTFFHDDKEFELWKRSRYIKVKELIARNIESVRKAIVKRGLLNRGGLDAFIREIEEKEE